MSDSEPAILEETGPPVLSDADVQLLTEARTANWKLQQYEFAYDFNRHYPAFGQVAKHC